MQVRITLDMMIEEIERLPRIMGFQPERDLAKLDREQSFWCVC